MRLCCVLVSRPSAQAAREEGLDNAQPDLNQTHAASGNVRRGRGTGARPDLERPLLAVFEEALEVLNQFRSREGAELAALIRDHNRVHCRRARREMAEIRSRAIPAFQSRLAEKIAGTARATPALDPQRMAQEAALLADRSDIGEEISRLQIHSRQLDEILDCGRRGGQEVGFPVCRR